MTLSLIEIMNRQEELMASMGWPAGSPPENEEAAKSHLLAAIHECTEAMNELNWKPWKKNKKPVDYRAYTTELMDIIQFVANAALVMGVTPREMEECLRAKWQVNYDRIATGEVTSNES